MWCDSVSTSLLRIENGKCLSWDSSLFLVQTHIWICTSEFEHTFSPIFVWTTLNRWHTKSIQFISNSDCFSRRKNRLATELPNTTLWECSRRVGSSERSKEFRINILPIFFCFSLVLSRVEVFFVKATWHIVYHCIDDLGSNRKYFDIWLKLLENRNKRGSRGRRDVFANCSLQSR